jgi:hypothetical protein
MPREKVAKIEFCEERTALWNSNAVPMGSTAPAITAWAAKVAAARAAYVAQKEAQNTAKSATNTFNLALDAMVNATANVIKQVKTQAALTGDAVYSLADIPVPATPAPKPAPGKAEAFSATIEDNGALFLKWACPNPVGTSGTLYQIYRKVDGETEFTYLGGAGEKEFTDDTLPAGAAQIMYQIQAVRSTAVGPWATFVVTIGTVAGGGMSASVSPGPSLAA